MRQVIARQASSLNSAGLENSTRQVKELQQAQAKDNEQIIKSLTDKNGDGLNSNVIKLSDYMKTMTKSFQSSMGQPSSSGGSAAGMTQGKADGITQAAMGRRQFNTLRPRMDKAKDFFTMRGFLDKTGIIPRKSGGIFSEYLDRGEEKQKYIDNRSKMDPTARLHGDKKAREIFGKQFDQQQSIQYSMQKDQGKLQEYRDQGFTEKQISRTDEYKNQQKHATDLAKVDPRLRAEAAIGQTNGDNVLPFTGAGGGAAAGALGGEESMLEQNRMVAEQTGLLIKIEENTRGLRAVGGAAVAGGAAAGAAEESGGLGLMDVAGGLGKRALGGLKTGASMLGKGAMGAARFLGKNPLAMAGLAVGAGAYAGYKGWQAAGDKEQNAKEDIKAKLESGEITQGEAKKLTEQVGEEAVVDRGKAAGKGGGMALGGAAGALKGAAAGAAIGSVIPVVGTAIGGLIGGTLGAVGGSYLGGKGGEYIGEKAGQLANYVPKAYESVKSGAAGLWEGAKGLAGDAGEGLLRAKNKVSDIGWMAKENASNLIDRSTGGALTKASGAISGAKNSVLGMFGMGDKVVEDGSGAKTTFKSDGSKVVEDGSGTKTYDKSGKLISEKSPTFMGASTERRADGSRVESYDAGPMSLKKETTAAGGSQTTSSYDLGITKVAMRETLTPRQMQERGIDAKMAAGLPSRIKASGTDQDLAALNTRVESRLAPGANLTQEEMSARTAANPPAGGTAPVAAGGKVSKIAGEPWSPGTDLSAKQLAVIEQGIAGGTNYSYRVMEQYDKQKGNSRAAVTGGGVSAASVPGIGDTISKQSGDNEQAKLDAGKSGGTANIVSAPTVNNNTTNQTSSVKLSPRNNDNTVNKYLNSRYAF